MQRRLAAVLVLALLVALAAVLWLNRGDAPQRVERSGGEGAAAVATDAELASVATGASVRSEAQATEVANEASAGAEIVQGSEALAVLLVRVGHAENGPLAGIGVHAHLSGIHEWVKSATDDDGVARFESATGIAFDQINVLASPTTTPAYTQTVPRVAPGEVRELAIAVDSGVTVSGRCIDANGAPVSGALVEGWCDNGRHGQPERSGLSDGAGEFVLTSMGPESWIEARHDGRGLVSRKALHGLPAAGTEASGFTIELVEATSFVARVTDASGRPIAGTRVAARRDSIGSEKVVPGVYAVPTGEFRSVSGADGLVRVENVAPANYLIEVSSPPYLDYREFVRADGTEQSIVLGEGSVVTGVVLDADGAPAAGAEVRSGSRYDYSTRRSGTTCDASGRFRLVGLVPDTDRNKRDHWIVVIHAGHAVELVENVPHSPTGSTPPVEVRLTLGTSIAGRVVDSRGLPLVSAHVFVVGSRRAKANPSDLPNSVEVLAGIGDLYTPPDGAFVFDHLAFETYTVSVRPPDSGERAFEFQVAAGTQDAELVIAVDELRGAVVRGRVVDLVTGEPIPKFEVWPPDRGSIEGVDGQFVAEGIAPGPAAFSFAAPGYASQASVEHDVVIGEQTLEFRLVRSAPLVLRIVDESGTPWGITGRVDVEAGAAAVAAAGQPVEFQRQRTCTGGDLDFGQAPTLPLDVRVSVSGGSIESTIVPGAIEGPVTIAVPGLPQVDVEVLVVRTDRDRDLDELVRRLRSDTEVDRAWVETERAAGRIRAPGEAVDFRFSQSVPSHSMANVFASWRDGGFVGQEWSMAGATFDGAILRMRLTQSRWDLRASRTDAATKELRGAVHVAFGPEIGPEPELGVVVLLD